MSDAGLRSLRSYRQPVRHRWDVAGDPPASTEDEELVREARERYRQIRDWEGEFRAQYTADLRFCNGDSDNHWQWPDGLFTTRDTQDRPSLTVNKTRQHVLQIVNDAKQNKPQVRVNAVSDDATKEAADIYEGVIRHIEYVSNASVAYDTATEHQVAGGIGFWRIVTAYESPESFDLGLRIQRIRDAMTVYMDPDIQEVDGSDARFAFIVDDVPRDQFETRYPEYRDHIPASGFGMIDGGWLDEDHVRVAEYYRRSETEDTLHLMPDGSTLKESDINNQDIKEAARQQSVRKRTLKRDKVEWFKIVGGSIVDREEWAGKYIPVVRVVGEETIIDGKLERKGHTRALKDPQRIYNYWTSSGVEAVALQTKTPWLTAAESIENYQQIWNTANIDNHAVLPYSARDDAGQPNPPPTRADPPQMPQAYIAGMQIAQNEMMLVSGQYAPTLGQPAPNEVSGKAISLRQRQGENATYHYVDNLAIAIRFTGKILIDLIPKVYDTPRVMRILNSDGSVDRVRMDPSSPVALTEMQAPSAPQAAGVGNQGMVPTPAQIQQQSILRIFNPAVGTYEVQADVGPAYATRRQQAYDAFVQVVSTAPNLLSVAGDLLFRAADFPMAEELAERLQRMVPPQALGQGPTPNEQALAQQVQASQAHIALLGEKLAVAEMKLTSRDQQKDIDAYEAVTGRLGTLLKAEDTNTAYASGQEIRALIQSMVNDALQTGGMAAVAHTARMDMLANAPGMQPGQPGIQNPQGGAGPPPGYLQQAASIAPAQPPRRGNQ